MPFISLRIALRAAIAAFLVLAFNDVIAAAVTQPDGKTVVAATEINANQSGYAFTVTRHNPDGTADASFGDRGKVRVPIWGWYEAARAIVLQPDGRIVIGGDAVDPATGWTCAHSGLCSFHTAIVRLNSDGSLDTSFNKTGKMVFLNLAPGPDDYGNQSFVSWLEPQADGQLSVYDDRFARPFARINADGTLDPSLPGVGNREVDFVTVIEYYYAPLDRYFLTANLDEASSLDAIPSGIWKRTAFGFHSHGARDKGVPVCRFRGPTHFYTADASECDGLVTHASEAWPLETRDAFRVSLPDPLTGTCLDRQAPIFRLWAPRADAAHRYTTSFAERDRMLSRGWLAEGFGPDKVAMCAAP